MQVSNLEKNEISQLGDQLINQLGLDLCLILSDYFKSKTNQINSITQPIFQRKGGILIRKYVTR